MDCFKYFCYHISNIKLSDFTKDALSILSKENGLFFLNETEFCQKLLCTDHYQQASQAPMCIVWHRKFMKTLQSEVSPQSPVFPSLLPTPTTKMIIKLAGTCTYIPPFELMYYLSSLLLWLTNLDLCVVVSLVSARTVIQGDNCSILCTTQYSRPGLVILACVIVLEVEGGVLVPVEGAHLILWPVIPLVQGELSTLKSGENNCHNLDN